MKEKVNIITLLWKGDFRNRDYTDEDVWNLYRSVSKWIDRPFEMYCLTNDMEANVPGKKIKLMHNWPGWWSKMELFRPSLLYGKTLYLDLDIYIVNSLQPLLDTEGDFTVFSTPYDKPDRKTKDGLWIFKYQNSVMLFNSDLSWMYNKFKQFPFYWMEKYRSDQDVIAEWMPDLPVFPARWLRKRSNEMKDMEDVIIISGNKDGEFRTNTPDWIKKRARQ